MNTAGTARNAASPHDSASTRAIAVATRLARLRSAAFAARPIAVRVPASCADVSPDQILSQLAPHCTPHFPQARRCRRGRHIDCVAARGDGKP